MSYPNDSLMDKLDDIIADASTASSAVGTIASGSDVVVSNFAGLQDLVDSLSAFASTMKSGAFYAPVGLVAPFGGVSGQVPGGWLLCAGQAVSQTTYADLYAVVGANAFGTDSGGNFYLPDLRGRTVAGIDNMGGTDAGRLDWANTIGTAGGAQTLPAHTHTGTTTTVGNHSHGYYQQPGYTAAYSAGSGIPRAYDNNAANGGYPASTDAAGSHNHTFTTDSTGTGTHGVMQPTMLLNYIIKW